MVHEINFLKTQKTRHLDVVLILIFQKYDKEKCGVCVNPEPSSDEGFIRSNAVV